MSGATGHRLGHRLAQAASLLPALALFAIWTGSLVAPALVGGVLLGALVRAAPWPAPPAVERLAVGAVLAAGVAASPLLLADAAGLHGRLGLLQGAAALAALLCAAFRRWFADPRGRRLMDVALEATALIACGMGRIGPAYGALALAWLVAALVALRTQDPRAGPSVERARPWAAAAVVALALGAAWGLALALPPAARAVERRLGDWWLRHQPRAGFSGAVRLGSLEGLFESDRVVLRLWGRRADYLRGAVFDTYGAGIWSGGGLGGRVLTAVGPARAAGAVEARFAGEAQGYFLPLGAQVATTAGRARAGPGGALAPLPEDAPEAYWFTLGDDGGGPGAGAPGAAELAVPRALAARLRPLAEAWTAGRTAPRARVEALAAGLQAGYAYDTHFRRPPGVDPVVDFLFRARRGHCEYFASALVLLARSAGVPARLVTGYRAVERNAVGGYGVVRERDAHAWVEAWLPGEGWRTFDATPGAGPLREEPLAAALADAAVTGVRRALGALQDLSLGQSFALLGGAVALFAGVRAWNVRRGRRARRAARAEGPPAWYGRLAAALAAAGLARPPSEPVERWARRVAAAGEGEAAALLRRYAALRYGGEGDAAALAAEMDACAGALAASGARRRGA